jgi:hypothetical protein
MTIETNLSAEEARKAGTQVLKGLRGAWIEYANDHDGEPIWKFVLLDADEAPSS